MTVRSRCRAVVCVILLLLGCTALANAQRSNPAALELSRPVRSFEFLPVVGRKAALFGNEEGRFEAWVYPMKLLRNLRLTFTTPVRSSAGTDLARTLVVRPESATIVYTSDTFSVRQVMFAPLTQPGIAIVLEVETSEPLEIEASFVRDFNLMWPAAIGGSYMNWDEQLHAFTLGEESKKYFGVIGSPAASQPQAEFETNYGSQTTSRFHVARAEKGRSTHIIVIAGSVKSADEAAQAYRAIASNYSQLQREADSFYSDYLARTVSLKLPDAQLQQAYDWARVSTIQGLVDNPFLGEGLVAGYRTSGTSQRPGFAWFFGRDSLWTDLALNSISDFATTRSAVDFISKFQRADGKMPHEISQSASLVDWAKYPYQFASADATPLYVITMADYVRASGDVAFAREKWDSIRRAFQFMRSTWDTQGLPQNQGVGHGWVEGGPLLPVKSELYQSALGAEAIRAYGELAGYLGDNHTATEMKALAQQRQSQLDSVFWNAQQQIYAFALKADGSQKAIASVESTVPMWFGLLDAAKSEQMIRKLAAADHAADWGTRIISSQEKLYEPFGYHFGTVWPLFTGWASVGEYKYHRADAAYANLRANSLLGFDGSLGHFTEVLSGNYNQTLSTGSPHQVWSAAMVISPMLRGMMGLSVDTATKTVTLAPHVPASWNYFDIRNVRVSDSTLDFSLRRTADGMELTAKRNGGSGDLTLQFSPAVSLRAQVVSADANGAAAKFNIEPNANDQHVNMRVPLQSATTAVHIRLRNDFGIDYASQLPPLGTSSRNLKIISQTWSADRRTLTLNVQGCYGHEYDLNLLGANQISIVDGASLTKTTPTRLHIDFAHFADEKRTHQGADSCYAHSPVTIHFGQSSEAR